MKIDFSAVLRNIANGQELQETYVEGVGDKAEEKTRPLTLGRACINALLGDIPNEERPSGLQMHDRTMLAFHIAKREEPMQLTEQERTIIKERAAIIYSTQGCGLIWMHLDGELEQDE